MKGLLTTIKGIGITFFLLGLASMDSVSAVSIVMTFLGLALAMFGAWEEERWISSDI